MLHTLSRSLRENKGPALVTVLLSALEVVFEIVIPLFMSNLIDFGIEGGSMAAVWKFGAFLLLFAGIYTMVINLQSASPYFEYVLMNMDFIFLIIVPILTMRVIAEERRQKTDQLLYSLPLTMTQVALGKYLAMLVIFLIPVAVIGVYPLVLTAFGAVYLPAATAL